MAVRGTVFDARSSAHPVLETTTRLSASTMPFGPKPNPRTLMSKGAAKRKPVPLVH
ncbi:hypothetical protein AKJ09_07372 [Labilithrix luteola]|uniref:Uncharacterized protein n=1 Tax=Labilithrix luteola TaxID=1391654 RepID=A0A0K1Q4Q6_9BACT|nr:hypothetical protein AKJ09_07372 [Labilithrix luteola]